MPILASGDTTLKISTSSLKITRLSDPEDRQEKTWKKRWIFLFLARLSRDGGFETRRPQVERRIAPPLYAAFLGPGPQTPAASSARLRLRLATARGGSAMASLQFEQPEKGLCSGTHGTRRAGAWIAGPSPGWAIYKPGSLVMCRCRSWLWTYVLYASVHRRESNRRSSPVTSLLPGATAHDPPRFKDHGPPSWPPRYPRARGDCCTRGRREADKEA